MFRSRPITHLLLGLCLVAVPAAAAAQTERWDQAAVTAIAKELSTAIDALRDGVRKRPDPGVGSADQRDWHRLKQTLRRVRNESRHLVTELEAGGDHDQTLPSYEHMMMLIRDAREIVERVFRSQQLIERITAARAALERLAPYYDSKPLPPPISG